MRVAKLPCLLAMIFSCAIVIVFICLIIKSSLLYVKPDLMFHKIKKGAWINIHLLKIKSTLLFQLPHYETAEI